MSWLQLGIDLLFDQRAVQRDGHGLNDIVKWAVNEIATYEIVVAADASSENIDIDIRSALYPFEVTFANLIAADLSDSRRSRHLHGLRAKVKSPDIIREFLTFFRRIAIVGG